MDADVPRARRGARRSGCRRTRSGSGATSRSGTRTGTTEDPAAPPRVAPDRRCTRTARSPVRHARAGRGREAVARAARRRRHRLEQGVEDRALGAAARRRPRVPHAADAPAVRRARRARRSTRAAGPIRTCSTRTRRSRSTATSAARRASPRCCCRAIAASCTCCRRCPRRGRRAACAGCVPAAATRWTSRGRTVGSSRPACGQIATAWSRCERPSAVLELPVKAGVPVQTGRTRSPLRNATA